MEVEGMIPAVLENLDIFPKEILGLPLVKIIEFTTDSIPRAKLVCKWSYRMEIAKLEKLREK